MSQSIQKRMYNFFHVPIGYGSRIFDGIVALLIIVSSASIPFYEKYFININSKL
jgi:carbon starvation protein CstA